MIFCWKHSITKKCLQLSQPGSQREKIKFSADLSGDMFHLDRRWVGEKNLIFLTGRNLSVSGLVWVQIGHTHPRIQSLTLPPCYWVGSAKQLVPNPDCSSHAKWGLITSSCLIAEHFKSHHRMSRLTTSTLPVLSWKLKYGSDRLNMTLFSLLTVSADNISVWASD